MIKGEYCTSRVRVNTEMNGFLNRLKVKEEQGLRSAYTEGQDFPIQKGIRRNS
jgi:hypothetical protein